VQHLVIKDLVTAHDFRSVHAHASHNIHAHASQQQFEQRLKVHLCSNQPQNA
jgi:hypothetical protein